MTTLHVIRHGKAMAGTERYDQLHPVGEAQSRRLGEYLREKNAHFDAIYSGPLVRQLDTLSHMRSAAGEVGAAWPPAVILAELSEAPIEALARHCMTERLATDLELQALMSELAAGKRAPDDLSFFEAVLAHVVGLWVRGDVKLLGVETAPEFGKRVRAVLARIAESAPREGHVAIVTSNGVIGWLAGHAENEAEPEQRCLHRRLFNASISRFVSEEGRLQLFAWNVVDHLDDSRLQTVL